MLWKLLTLHAQHSQWTNSSPKSCEANCASQAKHPESQWHGGSQISLAEFPAQMCEYGIGKITANRSVHYQSYVYPGKIAVHPALKHTSQLASKCKLLCAYQSVQQRILLMPVCYRIETSGKATKAWEASRAFQVQWVITDSTITPRKEKKKWLGMQCLEMPLTYSPCSPTALQRLSLHSCSVWQEGLAVLATSTGEHFSVKVPLSPSFNPRACGLKLCMWPTQLL